MCVLCVFCVCASFHCLCCATAPQLAVHTAVVVVVGVVVVVVGGGVTCVCVVPFWVCLLCLSFKNVIDGRLSLCAICCVLVHLSCQ